MRLFSSKDDDQIITKYVTEVAHKTMSKTGFFHGIKRLKDIPYFAINYLQFVSKWRCKE